MTLAFRPKKSDDAKGANSSSLIAISYNESMCRESLARMIIVDELPFKFVEHEGFKNYSNVLQPRFIVPTRTIIARDCIRLYSIERERLKIFLENLLKGFPSPLILGLQSKTLITCALLLISLMMIGNITKGF